YEVGVAHYWLRLTTTRDSFPLGPEMELHRLSGTWAEQRFEHSDPIPIDRWAVTARVSRERGPESVFSFYDENRDEEARIQRALLPLRLLRPTFHYVGKSYRISFLGHREPRRRATIYKDDRFFGEDWPSPAFASLAGSELDELDSIGQFLADQTRLTS